MSPEPLLTDELRKALGYETEPTEIEIDKSLIRRFAEAVGDTNPLWNDEAEAKRRGYGGLIAPPSLLSSSMMNGRSAIEPFLDKLPPRVLDGGGEFEIYQPIRVSDKITVSTRLAEFAERQGKVGPMLIVTLEQNWRNQRREPVAKCRATFIRY